MGIDPKRIRHSKTSFQGVTPGLDTHCMGFLRLEDIFGSTDNFRREKLTFHIVPFSSRYQALLGREAFARFNAIPHYASLTLKMPGPRGVITVNGNTERSLRTEEHTAALVAEVQSVLLKQNLNSVAEPTDTVKRVRTTLQQESSARQELD